MTFADLLPWLLVLNLSAAGVLVGLCWCPGDDARLHWVVSLLLVVLAAVAGAPLLLHFLTPTEKSRGA